MSENILTSSVDADGDLAELAFSALTPEQSIELEDRVYPVGVHADRPRPF